MIKVKLQAKTILPTKWGTAEIRTYSEQDTERMPLVVLVFGQVQEKMNVRLHSECLTGDLLGSLKCDCGEQLHTSLGFFKKNGGILIYLRQEGRDIGLINKIRAYALQEKGANTIEANHQLGFETDLRNYDSAIQILHEMGVIEVNILTNNPEKKKALENAGIKVIKRIPLDIDSRPENESYLRVKRDEMGHLLKKN